MCCCLLVLPLAFSSGWLAKLKGKRCGVRSQTHPTPFVVVNMIVLIVFFLILFFWFRYKRWHGLSYTLNVYFGVPGSGKTTFAAWLADQAAKQSKIVDFGYWLMYNWPFYSSRFRFMRHNWLSQWIFNNFRVSYDCWSNVPITGTKIYDPKGDLGVRWISDGRMIIDEAGVEFNNRNFKSFSADAVYFFKYHRHYRLAVDVISQSHEDMDVTLRRLAYGFYVVRRSAIPGFVCIKAIKRRIGIDDNTHQIIDQYYWGLPVFDTKWVFGPRLYHLFNSYSCRQLPVTPNRYW